MKRWRNDRHIMLRRQVEDTLWGRKLPMGRYRKKKALDCGKVRCMICHSEKILGNLKRDDLLSELKFKEGLDHGY